MRTLIWFLFPFLIWLFGISSKTAVPWTFPFYCSPHPLLWIFGVCYRHLHEMRNDIRISRWCWEIFSDGIDKHFKEYKHPYFKDCKYTCTANTFDIWDLKSHSIFNNRNISLQEIFWFDRKVSISSQTMQLAKGHKPYFLLTSVVNIFVRRNAYFVLGKGAKKKGKNLISLSFAFTHTYTPVKTNIFPFSPSVNGKFWKMCTNAKTKTKNILSHVTCAC